MATSNPPETLFDQSNPDMETRPTLTDDSDSDGTVDGNEFNRDYLWHIYTSGPIERKIGWNLEVKTKYQLKKVSEAVPESSKHYRYLRLFQIFQCMAGFHSGCLDLSGRHKTRYDTVIRRWTALEHDLSLIIAEASSIWPASRLSEFEPELLHDLTTSSAFRSRWRLCETLKDLFSAIVIQFLATQEAVKKQPEPQFQALCLLDLPFELLDKILMCRRSDIRSTASLGMSCRRLHSAGRRHVFHTHKIVIDPYRFIDPKYHWNPDLQHTPVASDETLHIKQEIAQFQDHFIQALQFLVDADLEVVQSIQLLTVQNLWDPEHRPFAVPEAATPLDAEFDTSFRNLLALVLRRTENLRLLSIDGVDATQAILEALSTLKFLQDVEFQGFFRFDDFFDITKPAGLLQLSSHPVVPSVFAAKINNNSAFICWNGLSLFPRMHTLKLSSNRFVVFPDWHPFPTFNPFITLERIMLQRLDRSSFVLLIHWLKEAPHLLLKDFRILTSVKTPGLIILELLHALDGAPLKTLMIDGIANSEMEVLEQTAHLFPNLVKLILGLRLHDSYCAGDEKMEHNVFEWPQPSWAVLAVKQELPTDFLAFKSEVVVNDEDTAELDEYYDARERRWSNEFGRSVALPFAAYCPTLETFSVCTQILSSMLSCSIKRVGEHNLPNITDNHSTPEPYVYVSVLEFRD